MMIWTAEIMTDPDRAHQLHVELMDENAYRARLYQDEAGQLQLQLYDGMPAVIPVKWLMEIISRFSQDLQNQNRQQPK